MPPARIVPSILAADFGQLGAEVERATQAGADRLQIDIMDGHFVPNISMGPMFVETVRRFTTLPLEAHLMVSRPEQWIEPAAKAGADLIIVHAEATPHLHRVLESIAAHGARPAVAINPASPLALIEEVLEQVSLVLQMTVNPGFGGQKFIPAVLGKIHRLRQRLNECNPACDIEVDGGIDAETIGQAHAAGANVFVAGSSVFNAKQGVPAALEALRGALQST
jgi:ribulose-phosphate 3-epimerase